MIGIWSIPFTILGIIGDGVNSLDSLIPICMTFICII